MAAHPLIIDLLWKQITLRAYQSYFHELYQHKSFYYACQQPHINST